jgi:hypothetical protein
MIFDIGSKIKNFPFTGENALGTFASNFVGLALGIAGIIMLVFLVIGGIEWIISGGDKAATESARTRITNALIGLAIVVAAWAIFSVIHTFLALPIGLGVR